MKPIQNISEFSLVLTTEKDFNYAEKLANLLLENNLAACINFVNIKSLYVWEGNIEKNTEVQLIIKTSNYRVDSLISFIKKNHSYKTPEIIYWPISSEQNYGNWIKDVLRRS